MLDGPLAVSVMGHLLGPGAGALKGWTLQPLAPGSNSHQSLRHGYGLNDHPTVLTQCRIVLSDACLTVPVIGFGWVLSPTWLAANFGLQSVRSMQKGRLLLLSVAEPKSCNKGREHE